MSRISNLPKNLPSKEIPFSIKIKGSVSGKQYTGDFVVSIPTVREMSKIGVEVARLSEGIPLEMLDKTTAGINNAVGFLKVTLKSAPAWFTNAADDASEEGMDYGLDTLDMNIPVEIFSQAQKSMSNWYKALKAPTDDSSKSE
jgi:hypothetical protein